MGNLFTNPTESSEHNTRPYQNSRKKSAHLIPDFSGKSLDWPVWKTQVKASLRTSNSLEIIESPRNSTIPEYLEERTQLHGVLQSTYAKSTARHIVNKHETEVDPFLAWQDLCEWYEGSANKDNNANQLRFRLDTLKLTSRTSADQHIQDFTEIKDDFDALRERYTKSAHISKFLENVNDPDFSEDARALARNGSELQECMKSIRRVQRKLDLDREKSRIVTDITQRAVGTLKKYPKETSEKYPKGITIDFAQHKNNETGRVSVPPEVWQKLSRSCKIDVMNYNRPKNKHSR